MMDSFRIILFMFTLVISVSAAWFLVSFWWQHRKDEKQMVTDYKKRLKIPLAGYHNIRFTTKSGFLVANGYNRIVLGGRGPYVEFKPDNIIRNSLFIPMEKEYKLLPKYTSLVYYIEHRTAIDNVKVYYQMKEVDYADYKVGMYYMSPFDLLADGQVIIEELRKGDNNDKENVDQCV